LVGQEPNPCCPLGVGLRTACGYTAVSIRIVFHPQLISSSSLPARTHHNRRDFGCDLAVAISIQVAHDRTYLTSSFLSRMQTRAHYDWLLSILNRPASSFLSGFHPKYDGRNQQALFVCSLDSFLAHVDPVNVVSTFTHPGVA
jgi:hypothetical protein